MTPETSTVAAAPGVSTSGLDRARAAEQASAAKLDKARAAVAAEQSVVLAWNDRVARFRDLRDRLLHVEQTLEHLQKVLQAKQKAIGVVLRESLHPGDAFPICERLFIQQGALPSFTAAVDELRAEFDNEQAALIAFAEANQIAKEFLP